VPDLDALLSVALDLTRSLAQEDRYRRLLEAASLLVPCDAACLLRLDGDVFVPVAARGLAAEALARRYPQREHPRLDIIARSPGPVRFAPDTRLPDPFDGMLAADPTALAHVHACLGCPLRVDERLVGLLTADALAPGVFDHMDDRVLSWLSALGGAALQTSDLIEALATSARRMGLVAADLMRSAAEQRGAPLLGQSQPMQALRREIALIAGADVTVLITGETGSGKELVARAIHAASGRAGAPLLDVNCAALPEAMAESELFGHVRGAFTSAERHRPGKFEVADRGTLFLDEIGELPLAIQPKLLRALQQGEIQRIGADHPIHVDVRVIAATNRVLEAAVAAGRFRQDLFHRLDVYRLRVPPLRERRDDIPLLTGHFGEQTRVRLGLGPVRIDAEVHDLLARHDWPGNVRELENVLFRAVLRAGAEVAHGQTVVLAPRHLGLDVSDGDVAGASPRAAPATQPAGPALSAGTLREQVDEFQRDAIRRALAAHHGNWAAAARALGLHRSNLHHLAQRLGLRD
jgi:anaerobic nitric oxide reductase transcription regulator